MEGKERTFSPVQSFFLMLIPPDMPHRVCLVTMATKVELSLKNKKKKHSRHHFHTKVAGGQRKPPFTPPVTPEPIRK